MSTKKSEDVFENMLEAVPKENRQSWPSIALMDWNNDLCSSFDDGGALITGLNLVHALLAVLLVIP